MARQYSQNTQAAADARAQLAADARRKAFAAKRIEWGAAALLVLVGGIRVITGFTASSAAEKNVELLQNQVSEAKEILEQKKLTQGDASVGTIVEVDATVNSAAEAGVEVRDMQNQLTLYMKQMREKGEKKLSVEHTKLLERLRSNFVDPKGTVRGAWCEYGTWSFDSTFDYEGNTAQVVWKCVNNSGELLACCIATYNGEMDKFQNAVVYRTVIYDDTVAQEQAIQAAQPEPEEDPPVTSVPVVSEPIIDSTTSESEPDITIPSDTVVSEPDIVISEHVPDYTYPEEQWLYGWSKAYQCWGYFNQDGRFLTEEEYQNEVNW